MPVKGLATTKPGMAYPETNHTLDDATNRPESPATGLRRWGGESGDLRRGNTPVLDSSYLSLLRAVVLRRWLWRSDYRVGSVSYCARVEKKTPDAQMRLSVLELRHLLTGMLWRE